MDQVRCTGHISNLVKTIILFNNGSWHSLSHGRTHSRENFLAPEHVPSLLMTSLDAEFNSALHRPSPMHRTYFQTAEKIIFFVVGRWHGISHGKSQSRENFSVPEHVPSLMMRSLDAEFNSALHRWSPMHRTYFRLLKKIIFFIVGRWHGISHGTSQSRENFSAPEHVPWLLMTSLDAEFNSALHRPSPMHRTYFQAGKKKLFFSLLVGDMVYHMVKANPERISQSLSMSRR
jgi:UDP-N-acetylglucosamine pyrophosphorylase